VKTIHHKGEIAMIHYNTLGNKLKAGMLSFSKKISKPFGKVKQRFISEMFYGIAAAKSCVLTEIARSLKEDIALKKTEERLARQLSEFTARDELMQNFICTAKSSIGKDTMILVDGSDATKPCSPKMEAIGTVLDGSTGKYAQGEKDIYP
jgi:hypothetical protein